MSLVKHMKWLIAASLVVMNGCQLERTATRITVPRSQTGAVLGIARFPLSLEGIHGSPSIKLRLRNSKVQAELLLKPFELGEFAETYWAVSTDGKFKVRSASREEWTHADPEPSRDSSYELPMVPPAVFQGRTFPTGGKDTGYVLGSATGRYLASETQTIKRPRSIVSFPSFGGAEVRETHLEIFDVATQTLLLSAFHSDPGDSGSRSSLTWLGDRLFVAAFTGSELPQIGESPEGPTVSCFVAIMPVS